MRTKNAITRNYFLSFIILSLLLFLPTVVLAEVGDKSPPITSGAGGGAVLIALICYLRRHKPIGGWLLYYVITEFVGFFVWLIFSMAALSNYNPALWAETMQYFAYVLTTIPTDLLTIAMFVLVFGLILKSYRGWRVIKWLRLVLGLSVVFYLISILIDLKFFGQEAAIFEFFGLMWSGIWFMYFLKSERVKSIYRDKNFEIIFATQQTKEEKLSRKQFKKELKDWAKQRQHEKAQEVGLNFTPNRTSFQEKKNSFFRTIISNLDSVVLVIGGILISLRLFFPPKYYLLKGVRFPYDGSRGNFAPTPDYQTALLHALGIAVITGILFFLLRKKKQVSK